MCLYRYVWREDLQRELVLALRPIQCGDEITVTYKQRYQVQERVSPDSRGTTRGNNLTKHN